MYRHSILPGLVVLFSLCGACGDASSTSNGSSAGAAGAGPCDGVFEGDYSLTGQEALDGLAGYCEVTGSLVIYRSSLDSFSVLDITAVGGDLSVLSNASLTSFSLDNLKSVGGSVTVETNEVLTSFSLPALTDVGEGQFDNVSVKHNDTLISFSLPALTRMVGSLFVRFNGVLTSFDLSALTGVGDILGLTDNDALAQCLVDALVAQVEAGEGIGGFVDPTGGPNNPSCTCEDVAGVTKATCP